MPSRGRGRPTDTQELVENLVESPGFSTGYTNGKVCFGLWMFNGTFSKNRLYQGRRTKQS